LKFRSGAVVDLAEDEMNNQQTTHVTVTDVDMPFFSMVSFMIKWALATIPAFFILAVVGGMLWTILRVSIASH
jgi:hypothetical protein